MATCREPACELSVAGEYDVVVVGGGCAGLSAALASVRNGVRTLIIERFPYFGGTATASLMGNINGFRNQVEPDSLQTVKGIAQEIILELHNIKGLGKSPYKQKEYNLEKGELSYSYAIDTEKFKYVTLRLMVESGADILFHTYFCAPLKEGERVRGVIVENKSGRQAVMAKVVVDASGDADVAARAGADFWQVKGSEAPRLNDGLMYKIAGFATDTSQRGCLVGNEMVVWGPGDLVCDGTNAWELTKAEIQARLKVFEHFQSLKQKSTGLDNAFVAETPPLLGVRQTRLIEGEYKLTAEDALEGRRFDDVVAISSAPIIHYYGYRRYLDHEGFDIPYRCLVPKKIDALLVAGRCISSQQQPYESFRSMAPIMAIGEAAGTAAALAVKTGVQPRALEVTALQRALMAHGAELRK